MLAANRSASLCCERRPRLPASSRLQGFPRAAPFAFFAPSALRVRSEISRRSFSASAADTIANGGSRIPAVTNLRNDARNDLLLHLGNQRWMRSRQIANCANRNTLLRSPAAALRQASVAERPIALPPVRRLECDRCAYARMIRPIGPSARHKCGRSCSQ